MDSGQVSPYLKFRRAARAIKSLVQVCHVCKDLVFESIQREDWFAFADSLLEDDGAAATRKRGARPYTARVTNDDDQTIDEITFDASDFRREYRTEYLLTESVRAALGTESGKRSAHQISTLVHYLKKICPEFGLYPVDKQRKFVECMWYDSYEKNRVLTKTGTTADALHFLLSGTVVLSSGGGKLVEIKAGRKFGEEELTSEGHRHSTVVTKSAADVVTVHRQDYRTIMNLSEGCWDPKKLEICKQDIVWSHFPLHELEANPAAWTVMSYKKGSLIATETPNMDWLYVVTEGEAKVVKQLRMARVDPRVQRRRAQCRTRLESNFIRRRDLRDFGENSHYVYAPCSLARKYSSSLDLSAVQCSYPHDSMDPPPTWVRASTFLRRMKGPRQTSSRTPTPTVALNCSLQQTTDQWKQNTAGTTGTSLAVNDMSKQRFPSCRAKSSPPVLQRSRVTSYVSVPPFVELEILRPGQGFGFRSCIGQCVGSSVNLVSDGCEVLRVSKKIFLSFSDETTMGLIQCRYKAYPTEEEIIDKMHHNVEWEQYKLHTVLQHIQSKGRESRPYSSKLFKLE